MTNLPAYGTIKTIACTNTHALVESKIFTPHTIITKTKWKYRRN